TGRLWNAFSVLRTLDSPHSAGILVFRGQEIGPGNWPAIIPPGTWAEIRERRSYRAAQASAVAPRRFFLLRGLVTCSRCGTRMSGTGGETNAAYKCNRSYRIDERKCARLINAPALESFVSDAAVDLLTRLDPTGQEATATLSEGDRAAIDADRVELAELKAMWEARELPTR